MSGEHILVIDDEPDIRGLVREILEDEGYEVSTAEDAEQARLRRRERRPDLVLLDIWMPGLDGISLLKEWREEGELPFPVIMMSGHGTVETAVEATRLGAYDFIEKPISLAKLLLTVERALQAERLARENLGLRRKVAQPVVPIGDSAAMRELRQQLERIARHDTPVLITGEQGAGKQICARYLHAKSARAERPFVELSLVSHSRESVATELFGCERNDEVHYGLLEQANGGILYIEELTDLDLPTQTQLLAALESGSFLRVGGSEPVHINVRVIAASHEDLDAAVREGRLREDLYYRLNVVPVQVPPLREHAEDVAELVDHYVELFHNQQGLPWRRFPVAVKNTLMHYHWPGNIRELQNLVQRLLILGTEPEVSVEEVTAALSGPDGEPQSDLIEAAWLSLPLREAREQFERTYLLKKLRETGGNISRLAREIGMERTHLYRKLKALDIDPKGSLDQP